MLAIELVVARACYAFSEKSMG